jgi:hypothetical protein
MNAFESYNMFNALKLHFSSEVYNYHKYNGKIKTTLAAFEARKDKYFYQKLAKAKDPFGLVLANILEGDRAKWIGGLINDSEAEKVYFKWLKRKESLTYCFTNEIKKLDKPLGDNFIVKYNTHPKALKLLLTDGISYETLIIINDLVNFFSYWNQKMKDDVLWPAIELKCVKYKSFMKYNKMKFKQIVVEIFKQQ